MANIFVSYKRVDKEKVLCITERIKNKLNVSIWMDAEDIKSDAQFAADIIDAIDQADVFLFMYSVSHTKIENYKTDWTIRELNYAQEQNKRIVFVNIDGSLLIKLEGSHHVYRGGCWCETDDCCVTARRAGAPDFASYGGLGLRLALTL